LRFVAERSSFSGLDLAGRFRHIHRTNLWGAAGSVSGLGSEDDATANLRQRLPALLRELGATSLLDAPCGDGGWISDLDIGMPYTGVDVVPELIDDLRRRPARSAISRTYLLADITRDPLPRADAVANFRRSGGEWLVTTTFPELTANIDCEDGDWRALNFALAPFSWAPPAKLLVEGCTEGDGGWADKSLAAWRIADLPHQFERG
jgi:hypothetical protein